MPSRPVGVADTANADAVVEVDVLERASPDLITTTTADPGTGGTLAVTSAAKFPASGNYKIRVESEVMRVTGGQGTTSWTVTRGIDGTTNVAHASGSVVSYVVGVQRVSPVSERAVSFIGMVASFRTLGNAATPQNLFTIENAAGSAVLIAIRKLRLEMDATALLVNPAPEGSTSRPASLPTAGTTLTKVALDTGLASNTSVVCRGATASDGGAATAITATAGSRAWHRYLGRMHTAVGAINYDDGDLLPDVTDSTPLILRANQSLLVQVVASAAASNAATNHYVVKCLWEEFTVQ